MKKFLPELSDLAWTLGGTGLVLITLSGETLKWGLWISAASVVVYLAGVLLSKEEED